MSRLAVVALGLVAALVPSAVGATRPTTHPAPGAIGLPVRVSVELYDPCFGIGNATGTDPIVVIHRRDGRRVGTATVAVADFMRPCTGTLRPKDTLELRQSGARLRKLTIPGLTLRVDLAAHRLVGSVPTSGGTASVSVSHRIAGLNVDEVGDPVTPAGDGSFTWAPSDRSRLWAGDNARLAWTTSVFDAFSLLASTPSVTVSTWTANVTVTGVRGSRVAITARNGSTPRATYARQLPPYETLTYGVLRRNGTPTPPRKGDTIAHGGIDGVALTVLSNAMTVNPSGNGSLATTCFPNGQVVVDSADKVRIAAPVPASGVVKIVDLTGGTFTLQTGDLVYVGCQNRKGGAQLKRFVVP